MFSRIRCSHCDKRRSYMYPWLGVLLRPWYECIPCRLHYCHNCAKGMRPRRWYGLHLKSPARACPGCHRTMPPDSLLASQVESLGHYIPFLVMGALVYSAGAGVTRSSLRPYTAVVAITLSIAMGLGLESIQVLLPERGVEASDVLFGATGAIVGVWAASLVLRRDVGRAVVLVVAASIVMVALAL